MIDEALEILIQLRLGGYSARVDGETLFISPKETLSEEDREAIRELKPRLFRWLDIYDGLPTLYDIAIARGFDPFAMDEPSPWLAVSLDGENVVVVPEAEFESTRQWMIDASNEARAAADRKKHKQPRSITNA